MECVCEWARTHRRQPDKLSKYNITDGSNHVTQRNTAVVIQAVASFQSSGERAQWLLGRETGDNLSHCDVTINIERQRMPLQP